MKRVGIITILKADNFGAELQAYATQKTLEMMGYESEIIDYLYFKNADFRYTSNARPTWSRSKKAIIVEFVKYRLLNKLLAKVVPLIVPRQKLFYQKFLNFHLTNTKLSQTYHSIEELYNNPPIYDVYIVGSDQVWNPATGSTLAPYFLTFVNSKAKKISYASSFGVSEIPSDKVSQYKEWINNLDSISVREVTGIDIVKTITGRDANLVLDPTLLLTKEQWMQVKPDKDLGTGYVLIYNGNYRSEKILQMARKYAKEHNVPIYRIERRAFLNKRDENVINIEDCGPSGFVNLIARAGLVLTGSFHGTAFSLNMGVPFYTIVKHSGHGNSRVISLLSQLDLSRRIIEEDAPLSEMSCDMYDVSAVSSKLNVLRELSLDFLRKSIDA